MSSKTDFKYERYRLGELSAIERLELESEPDFDLRMAALDESDGEILRRYPAGDMGRIIRERAAPETVIESRHPIRYLIPLAAAALLIAAVVLAIPGIRNSIPRTDQVETLRPKGLDVPDFFSTPEIVLYRNGPDGIELLKNGDIAREHDLLQVGFQSGGNWWGTIISIDGNGILTRHWPMNGDFSVRLRQQSEFLLPYSYELDDAPDYEVFILIWSDAEFALNDAETLFSDYAVEQKLPETDKLNTNGKTGQTVIKVNKTK